MIATFEPATSAINQSLQDLVESACQRIPPLWPLKNFIAVNPFVGLTDRHFVEAARLIQKTGHGEMLMPASFYQDQIAAGEISEADFREALAIARQSLPKKSAGKLNFASLTALQEALEQLVAEPASARLLTFADFLDAKSKTNWAGFVVEEISKWCSAYFDQGQSSWRMPWRGQNLFSAWKAAAQLDANPELMGLKKFRAFVPNLPDNHLELIDRALGKLGVAGENSADFLHRQLMSLPGWSSYVQYLVREKSMAGQSDDSLAQLLAIRLVYDLALLHQFGKNPKIFGEWQKKTAGTKMANEIPPDLLARFVAQQALECGYQNQLIAKLKSHSPQPAVPGQKALQAVFCIDVRSEVFRRALEAQSAEIETIGFAGFFGMAIEYIKFGQSRGGAQCPVLLTPGFKIREGLMHTDDEAPLLRRMKSRQTVLDAWNAFKTSAISCFSFVETAGLWFGIKLAKDSLALTPAESAFASGKHKQMAPRIERHVCCAAKDRCDADTGIAPADQVALAAGLLKNMGLISDFAKVVFICGHGSATVNNPYGSALDCGACGGHAGDANARVAALILNQPAVREGLKAQGFEIPAETIFIAGLHNTTTDEIVIYEDKAVSARQLPELEKIKRWLSAASRQARRERAVSLGLGKVPDPEVDENIFLRSRDWSQVRPEWGLAGNAAFIAAPRERTKGLNLGGRTFLHNYEAHRDPNKGTLELILIAPMVVASWINLQYYGSTVDNRLFGSGNKVLHNIVGTFGVWQGNGGDLQPGLPLQSIHDGTRLMHEPLRLSVFIEAARADIENILVKHAGVRELVENGWVHLFAMEKEGKEIYRFVKNNFAAESL